MIKEVKDFPGYFVTDGGDVIGKRGHVLSGKVTWDGYREVILSDCDRRRSVRVHTLVWETFVGEIEKGLQINHKDGNKLNNSLDNLEKCTAGHNVRHAFVNNLYKSKDFKGKRVPSSLTREEILQMRELRDKGLQYKEISAMFNLSTREDYIGEILSGRKLSEVSGFNR